MDDSSLTLLLRALTTATILAVVLAARSKKRLPKRPLPPRRIVPSIQTPWIFRQSQSAQTNPSVAQSRKESVKLQLDVGQFAPMSDTQVRKAAGGIGSLWGNPWFGRRDLIPPPEDPRTALIDRAMVGHGLITPEKLVEIHEVGRQMDELRPDLAVARTVANDAVRLDREARARLREEKKQQAAERKRLHAQAVAFRSKTDILFLGRGVSAALADRQSNVEKLQAAGLPSLSTPADVAAALKISVPRLRWLAFHSDASGVSHYIRFTVPKKRGGVRQLAAPHRDLAAAQEWILLNVLMRVPPHDAAHGFVAGRSTLTNAAPHAGRAVVVNADLTDFFPTISFHRTAGVFRELGFSPAVACVLALLCTEAPRRKVIYAGKTFFVATGPRSLPQGACTSPALSNLVARRMDSRLAGIAAKLNWRYTRYADDLSFSADAAAMAGKTGYLLARIRHITQDEGFQVNESKTRVLRRSAAQVVTGLVVNDHPGVPRETIRRVRAILHRATAEGLAAQNPQNHPHFEAWLRGMIAYIQMANPSQGNRLRQAMQALRG